MPENVSSKISERRKIFFPNNHSTDSILLIAGIFCIRILSIPALRVIGLRGHSLQEPLNRTSTIPLSKIPENSTSPPSSCRKGLISFKTISIFSCVSSNTSSILLKLTSLNFFHIFFNCLGIIQFPYTAFFYGKIFSCRTVFGFYKHYCIIAVFFFINHIKVHSYQPE